MERKNTFKITYVPHTKNLQISETQCTILADKAKILVIDYILKRLILKPTERAGYFVDDSVNTDLMENR